MVCHIVMVCHVVMASSQFVDSKTFQNDRKKKIKKKIKDFQNMILFNSKNFFKLKGKRKRKKV